MEFFEKSLRILELPAILEMLAAESVSEAAKEAALELRPSDNIRTVKSLLAETSAAKNMMILRSSPPFSGVKDIRATIRRADLGGKLNTRELLDIAALFRASAASIAYAGAEAPELRIENGKLRIKDGGYEGTRGAVVPRNAECRMQNAEIGDGSHGKTAIDHLFSALVSNKHL